MEVIVHWGGPQIKPRGSKKLNKFNMLTLLLMLNKFNMFNLLNFTNKFNISNKLNKLNIIGPAEC